ncbi:MAG: sialate O-acetylesterase [Armatimonadota bacterium]|nr:sialate O-acetylesterase [bacterium]
MFRSIVRFAIVTAVLTMALGCAVYAQDSEITVLSPRKYQVFQRQGRYEGYVLVSGSVIPDCDRLEVRITGKSLKGELPGKWQALPLVARTKGFASRIAVVPGGWYKLELRATKNGRFMAQEFVENIGVGEVFVGAGQSNSTNYGQFQTKQTSGMVSSFNGTAWRIADDPQWGVHDNSGGGSFWPSFGDAMYAKYHVPIGVATTGHGGTSTTQWQPDAPDGLFPWMMTRIYQLGPLGFRAVLWHQGEGDAQMPTEEYVTKLSTVINRSKADAGWDFPWFVAWASYHNAEHPSWPLVRAAQKELWDTGVALEGPDTDTLTAEYRDYDGNGIHFNPKGLKVHGEMWAEKVGAYLDAVLGK